MDNRSYNRPSSPVPGGRGSSEFSMLEADERAHASKDPWTEPDWMKPWWHCPFCGEDYPPSSVERTGCPVCRITFCRKCGQYAPVCEPCMTFMTSGGLPPEGVGPPSCPDCFLEGHCTCGARVS